MKNKTPTSNAVGVKWRDDKHRNRPGGAGHPAKFGDGGRIGGGVAGDEQSIDDDARFGFAVQTEKKAVGVRGLIDNWHIRRIPPSPPDITPTHCN